MAVQTLTLRGEQFVVIPKKEYQQLKRASRAARSRAKAEVPSAEDLADIAEIERIKADPTVTYIPWEDAKKLLK
jgi:hypothetical protein